MKQETNKHIKLFSTSEVVLVHWTTYVSACLDYNFVSTHVDRDMYPPTQNITKDRPCARFIYFPKYPFYELHICTGIMVLSQLKLEIWPKMAQNNISIEGHTYI